MSIPVWTVGEVLASSDVNEWFVVKSAYKTGSLTRSSSTLTADPDLSVTLTANAAYDVAISLIYQGATSNVGFKFSFTAPSGAAGGYTANLGETGCYGETWSATVIGPNPDTTVLGVQLQGSLVLGSSGGAFTLNWASNSGGTNMTIGAGSKITFRRNG